MAKKIEIYDVKLSRRVDDLVRQLRECYPDGKVAGLNARHKTLSNKIGEIWQRLSVMKHAMISSLRMALNLLGHQMLLADVLSRLMAKNCLPSWNSVMTGFLSPVRTESF